MLDHAQTLIDQGYAAHHEDRLELALTHYEAAAQALRSHADPQRLAHTIRHVADIQRELAQHEASELNYAEALSLYRATPDTQPLDLANTLRGYALLRDQCGDRASATSMWLEAGEIYAALGIQAGVDESARRGQKLSIAPLRLHNS